MEALALNLKSSSSGWPVFSVFSFGVILPGSQISCTTRQPVLPVFGLVWQAWFSKFGLVWFCFVSRFEGEQIRKKAETVAACLTGSCLLTIRGSHPSIRRARQGNSIPSNDLHIKLKFAHFIFLYADTSLNTWLSNSSCHLCYLMPASVSGSKHFPTWNVIQFYWLKITFYLWQIMLQTILDSSWCTKRFRCNN